MPPRAIGSPRVQPAAMRFQGDMHDENESRNRMSGALDGGEANIHRTIVIPPSQLRFI